MSNGTITMTGAEYDALAGKIAALEAELAKLRAGQESLLLNLADQKRQADEYRAMWAKAVASSPQPSAGPDGWKLAADALPATGKPVLAFYLNSHGKGRRVRAEYIAAKTKSADDGWDSDEPADYDEQADEYFWPAGWYEVMDNWDDLTHMVIHEGEVTHWMPLPAAPAIAAARQEVMK